MIGIDTNVLVRYLVQDDVRQSRLASHIIETVCTVKNPAYICTVVLCELVWVLSAAYGYNRKQVSMVLRQIMVTDAFEFQDHELAWAALRMYEDCQADFADCVIALQNINAGCRETYSFDKKAALLDRMTLLK